MAGIEMLILLGAAGLSLRKSRVPIPQAQPSTTPVTPATPQWLVGPIYMRNMPAAVGAQSFTPNLTDVLPTACFSQSVAGADIQRWLDLAAPRVLNLVVIWNGFVIDPLNAFEVGILTQPPNNLGAGFALNSAFTISSADGSNFVPFNSQPGEKYWPGFSLPGGVDQVGRIMAGIALIP